MKIFPTIFLVALASRQVFATTSSETIREKFRNERRFTLYNSRKLEGKCISVCEPQKETEAPIKPAPARARTDDDYKFNVEDKKCPWNHSDRIDRIENMSRDECSNLCSNTNDCTLFSWGSEAAGQWKDICILCNSDLNLEEHTGFISYSTTKITNEPVEERAHTDVGYKFVAEDTKCPFNHSDRIDRHMDTTGEGCYELCKKTNECSLFSWGSESAGKWKDICILCSSDLNLQPQKGFISYSMLH